MGNFFSISQEELEQFDTEPLFKEAARRKERKKNHTLRNILLGTAGVALGAGAYYGASKGVFGGRAQGVAKSIGNVASSKGNLLAGEANSLLGRAKATARPIIDRAMAPHNKAVANKVNNLRFKRFNELNPKAMAPLGKLKLPPASLKAPDTLFRSGLHIPKV